MRVSGPRRLASRSSPRCTGQGASCREFPVALRSSTEPTTSSRRTVLRRPEATSWRATWAEACEQPSVDGAKVPCAPTPQGSGAPRDPLLAGGPEHPLSSARVRARLECRARLGVIPPGRPRSSFASPPAKEETFPKTRVLGSLRRNGAGEGLPLRAGRPASSRRRPSRGIAVVESQRWVCLLVPPHVDA
jgi:hypothetical protein